jgi:tetratricopeptide (TPR) repeat protein
MINLHDELARGYELQRQGQHAQAEVLFRRALAVAPDNADAHYGLGLACQAQGKLVEALASYQALIRLEPTFADGYQAIADVLRLQQNAPAVEAAPDAAQMQNRQGVALAQQGRFQESAACFREAIRLRDGYVDGMSNLGNVLTFMGQLDEARSWYEQALALRPHDARLLNNLSNLLREQKDYEGSAGRAREALALDANYAEAHNNLGTALLMLRQPESAADSFQKAVTLKPDLAEANSNLGEALRQLSRYEEAVHWCRQAVHLRPSFAEAHNHLGAALTATGALDEAVEALREALRLKPDLQEARTNLAYALWRLGRLDEAAACCNEALAQKPDYANGYNILGVIRAKQNRLDEALTYYGRAIELDSDFPEAHFHRGLVLLVQGKLTEGLAEYEWRHRCVSLGMRKLPVPAWDGSPFPGRTLLLHAEQGLGDTVMFIRYAALAKARGGQVLFSCPAPLLPLLSGCTGVDGFTVAGAQVDGVHLHASLLSLPYLLGTTPDTIPADVPYLFPAEERVESWRQQLAGIRGMKVGLVWQGNAQHPEDRVRSIKLERFEPLARIPGVRLVSVQVGTGSEQVRDLGGRFDILDMASRMDQTPGALLDAAALVRNLDLLISVDTALVHVAGALGVPVWMATPFSPDWRWLLEREDSPWYLTLRLFRAPAPAEWGPVIERMTQTLRELAASPH